jgi:uncharacterized protein YbjT (DUF2867 family)
MPYKNIAVVGAGGIGGPIAEVVITISQQVINADTKFQALLSEGANVVVVTRPESSSAKSFSAGIKVISVTFTDVPALAAAFEENKIEVVISTIGHEALVDQRPFGDAAKQAGVKLFLPSEFGFSTIGQTEGKLRLKTQFAEYLKEIGLPSARIFVSSVALIYV